MKRTILARPLALVTGLVLIVGLTAAATAATPEPTVALIPTITDWHDISLPLDAYVQGFADRQTVLRAEYAQTKRCVEQFGFEFAAPAWDKSPVDDSNGVQPVHYRLYGLLDEVHAKEMGYHSYGENLASESASVGEKLPNDYYNVVAAKFGGGILDGKAIPDGGCLGAAQREIEGASDVSLPIRLAADAWTSSNSDSRVEAAFASWSDCMADSGYAYGTPMEANNDARWSGGEALPEEIAVAVADVSCKKVTNLVGVRMAVDAAYEQSAIDRYGSELDAIRAALVRQVATASAILANH